MGEPVVFLSYNSADRPSVAAFQKLFSARGITTFLDRDQLVPGLPWPSALEKAMRAVRGVAVFLGPELGGWQKREMWFALDRQVHEEKAGHIFPVIPVLLPGADLTPSFLFANTWIDLRAGLDNTTAAELLDEFEHAVTATAPTTTERAVALCPYRGLEAFREEHAAFFAGRAAFGNDLFDFTLGKDLVAVVGPSGSGKSSVVQAGLVPLLRRQSPPATSWDVITFTPGADPFLRLATCLVPLLEPAESEVDRLADAQKLRDKLANGEIMFESVIARIIEKSKGTGRLLVVADQFEELFTLTPEPARRSFAAALIGALGKARFTLLLTLRADFYSQIIALDRELSDRLAPAQVNIGALTTSELRASITVPAGLVGLEFEPGLVDRILHDVGSEPGNLPLLEFSLTDLWSKRQGRILTNAAYDEIGGVAGALAKRAETEFAHFGPEEQIAVRRLFSRLVRVARPEEGAEDTRQRIELPEADSLTLKVARALAAPEVRLLVLGNSESRGAESPSECQGPTVEVAHEALIRNWGRLQSWINDDREFLLWRQRTEIQVEQWEQHARDTSYLLRGVSLLEADRWLGQKAQDVTFLEQEFIQDSLALRKRELEEEERYKQAQARADAEAKSAKSLRLLAFSLVIAALMASGAFVVAYRAKRQAAKIAGKSWYYVSKAQSDFAADALRAQEKHDLSSAEFYAKQAAAAQQVAELTRQFIPSSEPAGLLAETETLPGSPVKHLIVVMMENRSFDHMLGALKAVDSRIDGITDQLSNPDTTGALVKPQPLAQFQGQLDPDPDNHFPAVDVQIFGGDTGLHREASMQGFVRSYFNQQQDVAHSHKIMYYFQSEKLPVLATLATEFAVCDRWFSSVPGPSIPNRAFASYGTSFGQVGLQPFLGPEPYKSIFERMQEHGHSAKIYRYEESSPTLASVSLMQHHPEFFATFEQFLADARRGTLPEYSFVEPNYNDHDGPKGEVLANDEHPDHDVQLGEHFLATVYTAIHADPILWSSSVLLITYSTHGGIYDHVPPPAAVPDGFIATPYQTGTGSSFAFNRLGVRVPAVIVSPYVPKGTVDHTVYDHASIPATASKLFLNGQQIVSPRERSAHTFDHILTLPTPRSDTPVFQLD